MIATATATATATTTTTTTSAPRDVRRGDRRLRRPALLLALMALLAYTYNIPRGPLANADSHLALTRAIVEGHTLRIDRYAPPDLADRSGYRGHYYTDKDPGLSLLAVPVYAALRLALPATFFSATLFFMVRYLLTSAVLGLPAALFVALLWRFFVPSLGRRRAALLALGYALGTMAWTFSALLFSHMIAAMALFGAFMLLQPCATGELPFDHSRVVGRRASAWRWAAAGALCGLAVLCEYPSALVAALLTLFAAYTALRLSPPNPPRCVKSHRCGDGRGISGGAGVSPAPGSTPGRARRPRPQTDNAQILRERGQGVRASRAPGAVPRMALFAGAGLVTLAPLVLYNLAVYGSPLSQGYAHLQGRAQFIGGMRQGVEGIGLPRLDALWGITFSPYRGLFALSPFLLLALPGLFILWRAPSGRPLALLCGGAALVMLLFNSAYYFWDGGVSLGPRHFGPALPFLLVPVAAALRRPRWWRLGRALIVLSIAVVAVCCATVIIFLPLDQGGSPNPIIAVALARLWSGPALNNWGLLLFGLRGLPSLLPLALGEALLALALWRSLVVSR